MGVPSAIVLVLITILLPPAGVCILSGCKADFLINICLTLLGYIPGHIHAFYLEYVYYDRKDKIPQNKKAPGIFSKRINWPHGHGTIAQPAVAQPGL